MRGGPGRVAIASTLAIAFALAITTAAAASGQWTIVQGAVGTDSGISGVLYSTACAGTTCWAVGTSPAYPNPPLIETNSGTGWSVATAPSPEPVNVLLAITCVDAGDCWAVGHTGDGTLIEQYAGGAWSYVSSPNPPSVIQPELTSVSCVSLDDCWAVGWGQTSTVGAYQTLIEHYTGSAWTIVASPNGSEANSNLLNGIACVTASECWAVGGAQATSPLVEQYTGTAWVVDTSIAASGPASELLGITCSSGDCWAVGTHNTTDDLETQSLIERYDGTAWEPVSSSEPNRRCRRAERLVQRDLRHGQRVLGCRSQRLLPRRRLRMVADRAIYGVDGMDDRWSRSRAIGGAVLWRRLRCSRVHGSWRELGRYRTGHRTKPGHHGIGGRRWIVRHLGTSGVGRHGVNGQCRTWRSRYRWCRHAVGTAPYCGRGRGSRAGPPCPVDVHRGQELTTTPHQKPRCA